MLYRGVRQAMPRITKIFWGMQVISPFVINSCRCAGVQRCQWDCLCRARGKSNNHTYKWSFDLGERSIWKWGVLPGKSARDLNDSRNERQIMGKPCRSAHVSLKRSWYPSPGDQASSAGERRAGSGGTPGWRGQAAPAARESASCHGHLPAAGSAVPGLGQGLAPSSCFSLLGFSLQQALGGDKSRSCCRAPDGQPALSIHKKHSLPRELCQRRIFLIEGAQLFLFSALHCHNVFFSKAEDQDPLETLLVQGQWHTQEWISLKGS